MSVFQDIEACVAYAQLVNEYWKEIQKRKVAMTDLGPFIREFIGKIKERAGQCLPGEAQEWCSVLEKPPFIYNKYNKAIDFDELYSIFSERIKGSFRTDNEIRSQNWIDFVSARLKDLAPEEWSREWVKDWVRDCFEEVYLKCSKDLAESIFKVLEFEALTVHKGQVNSELPALLNEAPVPDGESVWDMASYRKALWSCRLNPDDKETRELLTEHLRNIFDKIKEQQDLFRQWVECVKKCEKEHIIVLSDEENRNKENSNGKEPKDTCSGVYGF